MTIEDFISNLVSQFKDPKDDDRNKGFYKNISGMADKCKPDCLSKLYNYIIRTEDNSFPFAMGKYYKYMDKNDLEIKITKESWPVWNICIKCGAKYSKNGRGCPKCREIKADIGTNETPPDGLILVQEDCFYCENIYKETLNQPRKLSGPTCGDYGKKMTSHCERCMCNPCCKQMMKYNADPKGTTEKYKSTELAQPWITEVEPLSQMAADMLEHMKKTRFKEFK